MATDQNQIRKWLKAAKKNKASHLIVVCDKFDFFDYPVEVMPGEEVKEKLKDIVTGSMQKAMEVYSLGLDIEDQLGEFLAWHYCEHCGLSLSRDHNAAINVLKRGIALYLTKQCPENGKTFSGYNQEASP